MKYFLKGQYIIHGLLSQHCFVLLFYPIVFCTGWLLSIRLFMAKQTKEGKIVQDTASNSFISLKDKNTLHHKLLVFLSNAKYPNRPIWKYNYFYSFKL